MDANGHQPDPLYAMRAYAEQVAANSHALVTQLEAELDGERRLQTEIRELLAESTGRERSLRKAVDALTSEPKAPRVPQRRAPRNASAWTISQAKVQEVWDLVRTCDGQFKPVELRDHGGLSPEVVRRALTVLRNQELVRIAGSTRGGGKLYALMPGAAEHEQIVLEPGDTDER